MEKKSCQQEEQSVTVEGISECEQQKNPSPILVLLVFEQSIHNQSSFKSKWKTNLLYGKILLAVCFCLIFL